MTDSNRRKVARKIFRKFQKELIRLEPVADEHVEAFVQNVHNFASKVEMLKNGNERFRNDLEGIKKVLELTRMANSLQRAKYDALKMEMERKDCQTNDSKMQLESMLIALTTDKKELESQLNATLHKVASSEANVEHLQSQKQALENDKFGILSIWETVVEECNKLRNEKKDIVGNLEKTTNENVSLKAKLDRFRQSEYDAKTTMENKFWLEIELAKQLSLPATSEQHLSSVEEAKQSVLVELREKIKNLNAECDFLRRERDEYRNKWKNAIQAQAVIIEID